MQIVAFIQKPTAQLTWSLVDSSGSRSNMSFDVPNGTLVAAALAAADVVRPLILAITGCTMVGQSLTYSMVDNAPPAAVAGSRVEQKGVLTFYTAAGKTVRYSIPGLRASFLKTSGAVNEDWPSMQALINGIVAADAIFCDSNGVDITAYKGGFESFRASTKNMLPTDVVPDADVTP